MTMKRVGDISEIPAAKRVCPECGKPRVVMHWIDQWSEVPRSEVPRSNVLRFEVPRSKVHNNKVVWYGAQYSVQCDAGHEDTVLLDVDPPVHDVGDK